LFDKHQVLVKKHQFKGQIFSSYFLDFSRFFFFEEGLVTTSSSSGRKAGT
jgi:hypothetical protein